MHKVLYTLTFILSALLLVSAVSAATTISDGNSNFDGSLAVNKSLPTDALDVLGRIVATDWTNVTITESQITNLNEYVNVSGDTMTGALNMSENNIDSVGHVNVNQLDFNTDWDLRSQEFQGINRLLLESQGVNQNAELFIAPKGTARSSRISVSNNPSINNFNSLTLNANENLTFIDSEHEGTASPLPFSIEVNNTQVITIDNTTLFTGIGTPTPSTTLHIFDDTNNATKTILTNEWKSPTPADDDTLFTKYLMANNNSNTNEFARISVESRDVTAGTEDGAWILDVVRSGTLEQALRIDQDEIIANDGQVDRNFIIKDTNGDVFTVTGSDARVGIEDSSPDFQFEINDKVGGTGYFGITNSSDGDVMVVDENSLVGIGTADPNETLDVIGNIRSSGNAILNSDGGQLQFGASQDATIEYDGTDMIFNSQAIGSGDYIFQNGNVGISSSSPTEKVSVGGGNILQTAVTDPQVHGTVSNATDLDGAYSVHVSGKYAYVAARVSNALIVVDISDPSNPTITGTVSDGTELDEARSVHVSGKYAYVAADNSDTLTVVDISDPSNPTITGTVSDGTDLNRAFSVHVSGKYAYVAALGSNALTVVDISDPSNPTITGTVSNATDLNRAFSVHVSGKYAYVAADGSDALTIVDISDPSNPSIAGTVSDATDLATPRSVHVVGRYAYVAASDSNALTVVNVSDPSTPTITGTVSDNNDLLDPRNVHVSGKYAYVAVFASDALTVVDISDPSNPNITGTVSSGADLDGPLSVHVSGKYAYVAVFDSDALTVVDISGIDAPTASIGAIQTDELDVTNELTAGHGLFTSGINVGPRGILSQGGGSFSDTLNVDMDTDGTAINVDDSSSNDIFDVNTSTGNVGIGTSSPVSELDVSGTMTVNLTQIRSNNTAVTCNSDKEGALYYDGGDNTHYGCNSTDWNALY